MSTSFTLGDFGIDEFIVGKKATNAKANTAIVANLAPNPGS